MKIGYGVTGDRRKALVASMSQALNAPAKYLGMPTAAYEVGNHHIDKDGTLTGADNRELVETLIQSGFTAVSEEYDVLVAEPETPNTMTIEYPLDGFTPEKLENLKRLVTAKVPLLKMALGTAELPIEQTGDTLKFPWFSGKLDSKTVSAYTILIEKLCVASKEKTRVTAKEREAPDNPKYAMRCFLLSLGFIGDEYKAARKVLLSKLDGNSAWRNGKKAEVADDER